MQNIAGYETSSISWCEKNYSYSLNICEIMNTLTGLMYIFHSLKLYNNLKFLNGKKFNIFNYFSLDKLQRNHINICIIFFLIGLFTMYFHGTLSYLAQILDEFSIYLLIIILDYSYKCNLLLRIVIGFIILNSYSEYNRFFLLFYGCFRSYTLVISYLNETCKERKKIFRYGIMFFVFSIIFWLVDIFLCNNLYISLHWLWHIFSSLSLYYIVNFSILNQMNKNNIKSSNFNAYNKFICDTIPKFI